MLTEEAFILLAMLAGAGLLALGVMELVWPAAPRQPTRRPQPPPPLRFDAAPDLGTVRASLETEAPAVIGTAPHASPSAVPVVEAAEGDLPLIDEPIAPAVEVAPPAATAPAVAEAPRRQLRLQVLPVDTCLVMFKDGRYADVISLGSAALEVHARMASLSDRPDEAAALVDLVGLAKQELDDRAGARAAFRAAVLSAGPLVRPTYVRHLVELVRGVVDSLVRGEVPADGDAAAACVRELRECIGTLDDALAVAPDDETLAATRAAVRDALSPACERLVAHLVSGARSDDARTVVLEELADAAMPAEWRERLRERLASVSSAEIGQLTAQAVRSVQEGKDSEALDALERAERLATALPSGAVAEDRREEFERRLWWGYTKVGLRRIETKKFEQALEPLFHALRLGGIDEERLGETRSAVVRALEALVEARYPALEQLAAEDAISEVEKLRALLRSSLDRGISEAELAEPFAKVTHLGQILSQARS